MAGIEHLIATSQLKTNILGQLAKEQRHRLFINYDREFDALMLLFVSPEIETVVHYVDDHVGLLYEADTLEIVGMQVEAFEHSFLSAHENVRRIWRLRDVGVTVEDFGDIVFAFERIKPKLARELVKAAEDVLGEPGAELAAALG
jgi:hypothetical protein